MSFRLTVNGNTRRSVQTDIEEGGKRLPCETVEQVFKVNEVSYDPKRDLLYINELQERKGAKCELSGVHSIEVVHGERTDIRGEMGSTTQKEVQRSLEITRRRNREIQVKPVRRTLVVGGRKK